MNDNTWNLRRLVLFLCIVVLILEFSDFETDWNQNWLQTPNLTQSAWSLNNIQATLFMINSEITAISFRFFLFYSFRPFGRFRFDGFAHLGDFVSLLWLC